MFAELLDTSISAASMDQFADGMLDPPALPAGGK
jgi:hypothetical protein